MDSDRAAHWRNASSRRVHPWAVTLWCLLALATPAQAQYTVGPQDVLNVAVFGQPTLTGRYTVEADGTLTFPLLGRVKAGGLTPHAIEDLLKQRLIDGSFLKQPQVTVAIEQYRSQRVFVIGEIRQSGEYTLTGATTIIEAIARAGSPTAEASGEVIVLRPAPDSQAGGPILPDRAGAATQVFRADLDKLRSGNLEENIGLRNGDTVFLPRGEKVYVYGQVRSPGSFMMPKNLTVLQALALAGGATERGATNRIRVARIVGGVRKELPIKLAELLQPGDTVIVPERYF